MKTLHILLPFISTSIPGHPNFLKFTLFFKKASYKNDTKMIPSKSTPILKCHFMMRD
jgi:hypothetical protein